MSEQGLQPELRDRWVFDDFEYEFAAPISREEAEKWIAETMMQSAIGLDMQ